MIAGVGGVTALTGIGISVGCMPIGEEDDPEDSSCDDPEPNPAVGVPVVGIGLLISLVGGVVYGTGERTDPPPTRTDPREDVQPSEYLF